MSSTDLVRKLFQELPHVTYVYSEPQEEDPLVQQIINHMGANFSLPSLPGVARPFATIGMLPLLWISWKIVFPADVRPRALARHLTELPTPADGVDYQFNTSYCPPQAAERFLSMWQRRVMQRPGRAIIHRNMEMECVQTCKRGERLARLHFAQAPLATGRWIDRNGTLHL